MKIDKIEVLSIILVVGITGGAFAAGAFPDTGQTLCYDQVGTIIACPAPGAPLAQDGSYQSAAQPNYIDNGNATVTDNWTGLMWIKDPNTAGIGGLYTWSNAISACENLHYAGYGDWRLPNVNELMSIVNYRNQNPSINTTYFGGTQNAAYWSSTTNVGSPNYAWRVYFNFGTVVTNDKPISTNYIRCVRGGP